MTKKKTEKIETPHEYYVSFRETHYLLEKGEDPSVEWGFRGGYGGNVSIRDLYKSNSHPGLGIERIREYDASYGIDDIPVDEVAELLIVEYQTGDTFGYDPAWCIAGVFNGDRHEAALDACADCFKENSDYKNYRPWDGYFEHLTDARLELFRVQA